MSTSPNRYIVVGMLRSGTTVTHHCLRGHPHVSALYKEVGVKPFLSQGLAAFTFGEEGTEAEQRNGVSALFDAMTSVQKTREPRARGMKVAIATPELAKLFAEGVQIHLPDVRIVYVRRRNAVARFGSQVKSQETGVWRSAKETTAEPDAPQLHLDAHDFAEYAVESYRIEQWLAELRETHEVFDLSYEDIILQGRLQTFAPLFEFVGVKPMRAEWLDDRKLSPPPESYISNYDDLCALYKELSERLSSGTDPEALHHEYSRPFPAALWRRGLFWLQRPGYAAYRLEQYARAALNSEQAN